MFDFTDQRVIVTGGTRGIGRGVTQAFLKAGATVIATYRSNEQAVTELKKENEAYVEQLDVQKCDVTNPDAVASLFSYLEKTYPSIEVLVNNSGIREDAVMALMEYENWQKVIDTNLNGTFLMTKLAVHQFMKNKYGRVINISSVGGRLALAGQANYAASKAAQIAMSKSLAKEVAKKGITVNNIAPGFIDTELIATLPAEQLKEYKKTVPMRRFGHVTEVAHAVQFLACKESAYITGTTLEIAGGL